MYEKELRNLTYGLFVVSSTDQDKSSGMINNTTVQVTDDPAKIAICLNKSSYTGELIRRSRKFTLSILDEDADFEIFRHFGFQSGRDVDKFASWDHKALTPDGLYYVTKGTNAWLECTVDQEIDLGSHILYIGFLNDGGIISDVPSASYSYYHTHIKPQNKPKEEGRKAWRCTICGYVYEGEDLPADFICPWCKHPASDFEPIRI